MGHEVHQASEWLDKITIDESSLLLLYNNIFLKSYECCKILKNNAICDFFEVLKSISYYCKRLLFAYCDMHICYIIFIWYILQPSYNSLYDIFNKWFKNLIRLFYKNLFYEIKYISFTYNMWK